MRKTILTALVVLLLMLAVSCDNIPTGQNEDGLVTLSINTGETINNSRSIDSTLAKQEANYVEVIFKSGTKYYRAEGYRGMDITVKIPTGDYEKTDAIVLIGRKSDGTLLATGALTPNDTTGGGTAYPIEVSSSTTEIEFTVASLTVELAADAATPSFAITNLGTISTTDITLAQTKNGLWGTVKCFQVPSESTGIAASLTFGGLTDTGDKIVVVNATPLVPEVTPVRFNKIGGAEAEAITLTQATDITPAIGGNLGTSSGAIGITFDTNKSGIYIITFKIPVVGLSASDTDNPDHLTWFIRAGTKSDSTFVSTENNSFVLLVKDSLTSDVESLVVTSGW